MTLVVDASVVVAALVDNGPDGKWAEGLLTSDLLAAPSHLLVEAANILRRAHLSGDISDDVASLAHTDLLGLAVDLVPYEAVAARAWELRKNVTLYDSCYVALAEVLDAPLATLDRRLSRASGPRCRFRVPKQR